MQPQRYQIVEMDTEFVVWDVQASVCEGVYSSKRNALRRIVSIKYPGGKYPTIPGNPSKRDVKPASSIGAVNTGDSTTQELTDGTPGRESRYGVRRTKQDEFYRLSPEMVRDVKANSKPQAWRRGGRVQGISR